MRTDQVAPMNCSQCHGTAATRTIIRRFSHTDYGHVACRRCGITFDDNVNATIDLELETSAIRNSLGTAGLLVPAGDVDAAVSAARALDIPEAFAQYEWTGRDRTSAFEANKCAHGFVATFERAIWPETGTETGKDCP